MAATNQERVEWTPDDQPASDRDDAPPRARRDPNSGRLIAAALGFGGFFFAYLYLGAAIARTGILRTFNALFNADCFRVVADLTSTDTDHYRTAVHPLFVLLFNPIGVLLTRLIGSQELASRLLCSAAGAATVVIAAEFFVAAGIGRARAWLWACILGCTSAQLFWASTPETFVFAGAALALTSLAALTRRDRLAPAVAAGLLTLGITLTNFAQAIVMFRAGVSGTTARRLSRVALFAIVTLGCAIGLSIAQRALYPTSVWFFVPGVYREDTSYLAKLDTPARVNQRWAEVMEHLLIFNVVAPQPRITPLNVPLTDSVVDRIRTLLPARRPPPRITFPASSLATLYREGAMALVVWTALMLLAALRARKVRLKPIQAALLICIAFNAALHFVYGDALFLYAPDWTFAVVASVALALGDAGGRAGNLVLGVFLALLASNDLAFMRNVVGLYR
jgi:hypothetical protein